MEDLAQLISGSISDMSQLSSTVKTDKCTVLQDSLNQERRKQEGRHWVARVSGLGSGV